jgi:hypothetical protein
MPQPMRAGEHHTHHRHEAHDARSVGDHIVFSNEELLREIRKLHQFLIGVTEPARERSMILGDGTFAPLSISDQVGDVFPAFTVYNQCATQPVYISADGNTNARADNAFKVPALSAVTFPVRNQDLTISIGAAVGTPAVVHLFRYRSLVPFQMTQMAT